MNIEQFLSVEIPAISRTILEYSTDNFISSYAEQLKVINYPKEITKLSILVGKLEDWYKSEIEKIIHSEYIHSKESHERSFQLLKELKKELTKMLGEVEY